MSDAERDPIESIERCRRAGGGVDLARALTSLGQIERNLRRVGVAIEHYEEAAAIYRAEGDALRLAHTVRHLGDMHRGSERFALAEPCYREALAIYRRHELTPPLDLANALRGSALLEEMTGNTDAAKLLWAEARELYAAAGVKAGVEECCRKLEP